MTTLPRATDETPHDYVADLKARLGMLWAIHPDADPLDVCMLALDMLKAESADQREAEEKALLLFMDEHVFLALPRRRQGESFEAWERRLGAQHRQAEQRARFDIAWHASTAENVWFEMPQRTVAPHRVSRERRPGGRRRRTSSGRGSPDPGDPDPGPRASRLGIGETGGEGVVV